MKEVVVKQQFHLPVRRRSSDNGELRDAHRAVFASDETETHYYNMLSRQTLKS